MGELRGARAKHAKSYAEIAEHFGISESTVYFWKRRGAPIRRGQTHDLTAIARWHQEWIQSDSGVSIQTSNYYLTAIKGFCRWLVRDRRMPTNPLTDTSRLNANTDRRRERRSLTVEEFARLIEATQSAQPFRELTGRDRAVLYLVASNSGLRESELASLETASYKFLCNPRTVTWRRHTPSTAAETSSR